MIFKNIYQKESYFLFWIFIKLKHCQFSIILIFLLRLCIKHIVKKFKIQNDKVDGIKVHGPHVYLSMVVSLWYGPQILYSYITSGKPPFYKLNGSKSCSVASLIAPLSVWLCFRKLSLCVYISKKSLHIHPTSIQILSHSSLFHISQLEMITGGGFGMGQGSPHFNSNLISFIFVAYFSPRKDDKWWVREGSRANPFNPLLFKFIFISIGEFLVHVSFCTIY